MNRDQVIEFFYLVGMADEARPLDSVRFEIDELVVGVAKNPQDEEFVGEAVRKMQEHLDSLSDGSDPRKKSSGIAKAWKKSKLLREGTEARKQGERVLSEASEQALSDTSSSSQSNASAQGDYSLRVTVRQENRLHVVKYAIRCVVPRRAQHGQLENLVRYAASSGMVYRASDDGLQHFNGRLSISRRAVIYSGESPMNWNYVKGSTSISQVEHTENLQLINTKSEHFAVVVVCPATNEDPTPEPNLFALRQPRKIEKYRRDPQYRSLREALEQSEYKDNLSPLIHLLTIQRLAKIRPLPASSVPLPVQVNFPNSSIPAPWSPAGPISFSQPTTSSISLSQASTNSTISSILPRFPAVPTTVPVPGPTFQPLSRPWSGGLIQMHPFSHSNGVSSPAFGQRDSIQPHTADAAEEESRCSSRAASWYTAEEDPGQLWSTYEPVVTVNSGVQEEDNAPVPEPEPEPQVQVTLEQPDPDTVQNNSTNFVDLSNMDDEVAHGETTEPCLGASPGQVALFAQDNLDGYTAPNGSAIIHAPKLISPAFIGRAATPISTVTQATVTPPATVPGTPASHSLNSPSNISLPSQNSATSGKMKKESFMRRVGRYLGLR
ncbi:hypothetical protein FS837_002654 [Tulasnella sp. UAMH 9824]|nr:hypothetical protein FS837_002654 [Tulasnella sp. UAMH 9824]